MGVSVLPITDRATSGNVCPGRSASTGMNQPVQVRPTTAMRGTNPMAHPAYFVLSAGTSIE